MAKKYAVLLFNLGGPANLDAVRPFLMNLFSDPAIIRLPYPVRKLVALLITSKRTKEAQEIYAQMGGKSPILDHTTDQANALEIALNEGSQDQYRCFIAMRYAPPFVDEAIAAMDQYQPDEVLCIPLYPQFSTTTTGSSFGEFHKKIGDRYPVRYRCCYPVDTHFCAAHAALIQEKIDTYTGDRPLRVLFSAHGLPQKIVDQGDPYAHQVAQTVDGVMKTLDRDVQHTICYQSKVGPMKWLEPSTETAIEEAIKDDVAVIIVPIAFVCEHSETLVELDEEYAHYAKEHGMEPQDYLRVGALQSNPLFIKALQDQVEKCIKQDALIGSDICCNAAFKDCPRSGR